MRMTRWAVSGIPCAIAGSAMHGRFAPPACHTRTSGNKTAKLPDDATGQFVTFATVRI
jgi:hypothetical protein